MSEKKPICGILAGEPEIIGERCADGATCHHRCAAGCWRRTSCAPLSGSGLRYDWSAEAEGVEVVAWQQRYICPDEGPSRWQSADERTVEILRRRDDYELRQLVPLTALSAVTAERDRHLANAYALCAETVAKGEQIEQLRAEVDALRKDAERWRYVSLQGDDMHWLNLLRVDLDDFGGNINAAVDALIDGEAPAMAAKDPEPEHRMDAKVKAAALILAEIDRLDRAAARGGAVDE